jgi:branched-subunit amino acid transport protein
MSDTAYYLFVCVAMIAATSITRGSFFVLPPRWRLPAGLEQALRYAPVCALTAIIVPTVLTDRSGAFIAELSNPRLAGALAGGVAFSTKRSMPLMIAVGMGAFTLVRLLNR